MSTVRDSSGEGSKLASALAILAVALSLGAAALVFRIDIASSAWEPPYSSLRSDPFGCRALFESLEQLAVVQVRRNYRPYSGLADVPRAALFLLGASWNAPLSTDIEAFVLRGGRLVVALAPIVRKPAAKVAEPDSQPAQEERQDGSGAPAKEAPFPPAPHLDWAKLGAYLELPEPARPRDADATAAALQAPLDLPGTLAWHSRASLRVQPEDWRVIYALGEHPVIAERSFGRGTIVLSTDSYFTSNEGLLRDLHATLLAWLVGASSTVIFDEVHLGSEEPRGVVWLARKYGLAWTALALCVLGVLFLWSSLPGFVPPREEDPAAAGSATGKDSASAFVGLLRRTIPRAKLLEVCFAQWSRAFQQSERLVSRQRLARVKEEMAAYEAELSESRDALTTFQTITRILTERQ